MVNVTLEMVYKKLDYLQNKVDEIETILLLSEEQLSAEEFNEFKKTREQMLKEGGVTLDELEEKKGR